MDRLDIDMFDEEPKVGDKVKVLGKIESIDEDSGEVEVSYDDVKIIDEKKRKKRDRKDNEDDDEITLDMEVDPNDQSLDSSLARAFPYTQ